MKFRKSGAVLMPQDQAALKYVAELDNGAEVLLKETTADAGTNSMLSTWRMWMGEVAAHMRHAGCSMPLYYDSRGNPHGKRQFSDQDAHELFTMQMLGADQDGKRLSWKLSKADGEKVATKEQRLFAMDKLVVWATERGIPITIPRLGEYADYREMQER